MYVAVIVSLYLTVQLLVQLADALCQLGQLLSNNGMMNSLGCVRLHIKVISHEIRITLCKNRQCIEKGRASNCLHYCYRLLVFSTMQFTTCPYITDSTFSSIARNMIFF